ncbi:MAG: hypothetical protein ACRDRQ_20765, partial [Pseudonocardiaceae bacterium]
MGEVHRHLGGQGERGVGGLSLPWSQVRVLIRAVGIPVTVVIRASQVVVASRRPAGSATGTVKREVRSTRVARERHKVGEADRLGPGRWVRGELAMHGALEPVGQD